MVFGTPGAGENVSLREMAGTSVSHQPLGLFTPFLLQWYSFGVRTPNHYTASHLVQWVTGYGGLVVKK
eukprot:1160506-Pelagomonas_calceolata.AAC.2